MHSCPVYEMLIISNNILKELNIFQKIYQKSITDGNSLVAQWLRIRLVMQRTWVQSLVREDPTCCRATKPILHNCWTCCLEPVSHNYWSPGAWSLCSTTRKATAMRSPHTATKSNPHSPQLEKAHAQQWRPNAAINK